MFNVGDGWITAILLCYANFVSLIFNLKKYVLLTRGCFLDHLDRITKGFTEIFFIVKPLILKKRRAKK